MNKSTILFLCSNLIKRKILATALTFWWDFLHSPSTYSSRVSLWSILIPKNFSLHVLDSFSLQTSTWWLFYTEKKVKFIWIHFLTVIPEPQIKAFRHTLNFINYLQFWTTTHYKWSVIIYITYQADIWFKQKEIIKKRKTVKISGPNMEPCGTQCSIFVQLLNVLFIFIFSLQ